MSTFPEVKYDDAWNDPTFPDRVVQYYEGQGFDVKIIKRFRCGCCDLKVWRNLPPKPYGVDEHLGIVCQNRRYIIYQKKEIIMTIYRLRIRQNEKELENMYLKEEYSHMSYRDVRAIIDASKEALIQKRDEEIEALTNTMPDHTEIEM